MNTSYIHEMTAHRKDVIHTNKPYIYKLILYT